MWDLAVDGETGDLIFGPSRDLLGAAGSNLTDQRILVRCKIPRGSFTFDADGTLGSRLYKISSTSLDRKIKEAGALIREAVEPMDDIQVSEVNVDVDENNRIRANVKYAPIVANDESEDVIADPTPSYDARVTI